MFKGMNKLTKALYATKCTKQLLPNFNFITNSSEKELSLSYVKPANQIVACYFV